MIPNLKSKLKAMSSGPPSDNQSASESNHIITESPVVTPDIEKAARGEFDGQIIHGQGGCYVRKRTFYGTDAYYGSIGLSQLSHWDFSNSQWWTRLGEGFSSEDIVFLDTETTGLSGGTGTYAFLIGLGFLTDQGLIVEQYLMRDFDEEYPLLIDLMDRLKNYRLLVTFNGKSFDWPLLESRLVYSRLKPLHWEDAHLDLLHLSRRLWGNRLPSCSLSSIEGNILGRIREDDIPGYLIPKVYLEYLDHRETEEMSRVIKHNEWDIAAMAALLLHISKLFQDPENRGDAYELLGIAKELERSHRIPEAAECYHNCIRMAPKHALKIEAKKRVAYLRKRHVGSKEAMELWADLADEKGNMLVFPFIEMAKHLEHKKKDLRKALDCTEKAIYLANAQRAASLSLQEELFTRKRRLIRKLERS